MIPAHIDVIPTRDVVLNAHFRIEPCSSCPIGGYLIVSPRVHVSSLSELSPDAQNALGATLAAATRAIDVVVHPRRVYCALFAEETGAVHFHLFPRNGLAFVFLFACSSGRYCCLRTPTSRLGTLNLLQACHR